MRVLMINAVYKTGSTGRMLIEMEKYYQACGIDIFIACAQGIELEDDRHFIIGNRFDWKLNALKSRITGNQCSGSSFQTYRLISYIERIHPDVIHLHNLHSSYVNVHLLLRYIARHNIPTVQSLHDCWNYTGKCTHYTVKQCFRWKDGCGNCPNLKGNIPSWFFDRTHQMLEEKAADYGSIQRLAVIGVSEWILNEAKQSVLKNAKLSGYVYNWIDLDIYKNRPSEELRKKLGLDGKFVILGVSNGWYTSKGLDYFIQLAEMIDDDEIIVLLGKMGSEVTLPKRIISIPPTNSQDELAEYYSASDVFMQLSLEESFGKVVAEALACETPVIAMDSTANSELVGERCGILVPKSDLVSVKKAYKTLKRCGKKAYGKQCRSFAEENFSMSANIEKYIDIYKEISSEKVERI